MNEYSLTVEKATPQNVAPFGEFIGLHADLPVFASWPGVTVVGPAPFAIGSGGEILHVSMARSQFPATVQLLERHFKHTQTYLSANGRPFVMVLGRATRDGLPDFPALLALRFEEGAGIAMHAGTWHEFPLALEDDTRFTVILRRESHVNELLCPAHPADARGPDLERYEIPPRARLSVRL